MSPTPRAAVLLAVVAALALVLPLPVALLGLIVVAAATVVDAASVRGDPGASRQFQATLARGVPTTLEVDVAGAAGRARVRQPVPPDFVVEPAEADERLEADLAGPAGQARVRQPVPPDFVVEPAEADERLEAVVTAGRRGRHQLADPAVRRTGPLGLGRWYHGGGGGTEVAVYPDLPAARRLAQAVRQGKLGAEGRRIRGPLGLGTDFESVREYVPDDDVRRINWRATARLGRPMTNQYRIDQNRDVVCLVDTGRLMAAPLGDRSRLDAALDAVTAVAVVAEEVGDRCGVVAFDSEIRREVRPRRAGARGVLEAVFDLEPRAVDSDYELAFTAVARSKRSFVLVITDLLEESAARSLLDAVPILARRHVVAVATVTDPGVAELVGTAPSTAFDVYAAAVAHDVLDGRALVSARLARAGAEVVEAGPDAFSAACVSTYLRAKHRARL